MVEGHELARRGLEQMLEEIPFVELILSTSDLGAAAMAADETGPEMLILACDLERTGVEKLLATVPRSTRTLMLIRNGEPSLFDAARRFPATGFLLEENLTTEELTRTIRQVADGILTIPHTLADYLLRSERLPIDGRPRLTPKEQHVLGLLAQGFSNKEISAKLSMSGNGVKKCVTNVLAKLNCPNRTSAVVRALKEGFVTHEI